MCVPDEQYPSDTSWAPKTSDEAVNMMLAGLSWLARANAASVPATVQADCLRGLERAASMHMAARARVLAAFSAQRGFEDDGQGSARMWLTWQTRVTAGAARGTVGWMRRLQDHPAVAEALAGGVISVSWARQLTDWTGALPVQARPDADAILLAAAAEGADLAGLGGLAEEIRRRVAGPDQDGDDGFLRRGLQLDTTFGGAGRVSGDLSARCAASLQAVLDSLGKKMGAEDTRTARQRSHDALEEACVRLLGSGCLPERAGQPVRLGLHLSLDQLLGGIGRPGRPYPPPGSGGPAGREDLPGAAGDGGSRPVLAGAWAGPGDDCDAAIAPVVTGRVDHHLLNRLAGRLARHWASYQPGRAPCDSTCPAGYGSTAGDVPGSGAAGGSGTPDGHGDLPGSGGAEDEEARAGRVQRNLAAAREVILGQAVGLLSGPGGLASWLRTGTLPPPAGSVSLPLDAGTVTDAVPAHLRRAITTRDRHCAAPGCDVPPAGCHVHHIIPRSEGGTTSLQNCLLLCSLCRRRHKEHYADLGVMPIWRLGRLVAAVQAA